MSTGNKGWSYVSENGKTVGPTSIDKIAARLADGTLHRNSLVWRDGFDGWRRVYDVEELRAVGAGQTSNAPAPGGSGNLLTQKLAPAVPGGAPLSAQAGESKLLLIGKIALGVAGVAAVLVANHIWRFLPGRKPSSEHGTELADRWFSPDKKEGAIIQCRAFEGRSYTGPKRKFRLAVVVSAGRAQNNRLPVDQSDSLCSVIIKNSDGKVVFNKDITTYKLCPS